MNELYKEHKWSELIENEIRRYGYNIRENSYLAKLLEIANKNEKRNPKVYIIERSLLREIVRCTITSGYQLEDCINKYIPDLSGDIKNIIKDFSEYGIPQEKSSLDNTSSKRVYLLSNKILDNISIKGANLLDSIIDLYTQNIPTAIGFSLSPTIGVVEDIPFRIFNALLPTLIHEYIHLPSLDTYIFGSIEGGKNINLYEIIDKYIKPSNPLYEGYENKEFPKYEIATELTIIYILKNAGIGDLSLNRMYFIITKLNEIKEIKEKVRIDKIPRERMLLSYLTAYEIHKLANKNENMKEILKNINEAINEKLEWYVEKELKNINSK